eukprot:1146490-Pelagomonas_calceolata.AAC.11
MVLKDSLGGNCRTVMVANINPDQSQLDESISTCRFAMRVALVRNQGAGGGCALFLNWSGRSGRKAGRHARSCEAVCAIDLFMAQCLARSCGTVHNVYVT